MESEMKKNHAHRVFLLTVLAFSVASIGCGHSKQSRFFTLNPLENIESPSQATGDMSGLTIGLGPVRIPRSLDRPQIVTRVGPNELKMAEFDRWASPLRATIPLVLADDLSSLLPGSRVIVFPWRVSDKIAYQVAIEIIQFDGKLGGDVNLISAWTLLQKGGRKQVLRKKSTITEKTGGSGYASLVEAMNQAIAGLSREIAQALQSISKANR